MMPGKRIFSTTIGSGDDIALGGVGSGNWGHKGRKGQRGGSAAGGAGAGASGSATIKRLATKLGAGAAAVEPSLTKPLVATVTGLGGEMEGLDFRLKSQASIESKIRRDAEEAGVSAEVAAKGVTDLVRYTAIFEPRTFTRDVETTQAALEEQGWRPYDHKYRNYFSPGNAYQGYNTVMVNKAGLRFELQFHTRDSFEIKERGHLLYEEARELPAGSPRREQLNAEMAGLWDSFNRPTDWESLPGTVMKTG